MACLRKEKEKIQGLRIWVLAGCLYQIQLQAGIILSKIAGYLDPVQTGELEKQYPASLPMMKMGTPICRMPKDLLILLTDSVAWVNIDKIYFDAYNQVTSATGQFYPDVHKP